MVRRVGGSVEVGEMAVDAGCAGQAVVVVDVARGALLVGVKTRQREAGGGVVEDDAGPNGRGVADGAVLWKSGRHVVGVRGLLEIGEMASHALRWHPIEHSVHVTLRARHRDVRTGQRESTQVVIERGILPVGGVVTHLAGGGEIAGFVVGVGRAIVVGEVASRALLRRPCKDFVGVTLRARHRGVGPGQCETGELRVVESGVCPDADAVTGLAGDW